MLLLANSLGPPGTWLFSSHVYSRSTSTTPCEVTPSATGTHYTLVFIFVQTHHWHPARRPSPDLGTQMPAHP